MEPLQPRPPDEIPVSVDWDAFVLRTVEEIEIRCPGLKSSARSIFGEVLGVVSRVAEREIAGMVPGPQAVKTIARRVLTKLFRDL